MSTDDGPPAPRAPGAADGGPSSASAPAAPARRAARAWSAEDGWWPDLTVGLVVFFVAAAESGTHPGWQSMWGQGLLLGLAAGLARRGPPAAVGLLWLVGLLHLLTGSPLLMSEAAAGIVLFGAARYGSPPVLWASGLTVPLVLPFLLALGTTTPGSRIALEPFGPFLPDLADRGVGAVAVVAFVVLLGSWLAGLAVRSRDRAETERDRARAERVRAEQQRASAEAERARAETERAEAQSGRTHAEEIAALRAEQARLARDVHDVVGHSLAVILAQAESAQYLAADDTARQRQVLTDIAASARQSLADVREVLSRTQDGAQATAPLGTFDSLVDGVRAAGHEVRSTEVGQSRRMPPETEAVAFRVLQEMLTNALKHGRRGGQVDVERHWEGDLRLDVANECPDPAETQPVTPVDPDPGAPDPPAGQGIDGMRRRLETVGGRLDVRRRSRPGGATTYTATAWLPLPEPEDGPAASDEGP